MRGLILPAVISALDLLYYSHQMISKIKSKHKKQLLMCLNSIQNLYFTLTVKMCFTSQWHLMSVNICYPWKQQRLLCLASNWNSSVCTPMLWTLVHLYNHVYCAITVMWTLHGIKHSWAHWLQCLLTISLSPLMPSALWDQLLCLEQTLKLNISSKKKKKIITLFEAIQNLLQVKYDSILGIWTD